MIDRVHLFKLRDAHATREIRGRLAHELLVALAHHGWKTRVGTPADEPSAAAWDLMVTLSFASDAERRADTTEATLESVMGAVRELAVVEKSWAFERYA